MNIKFSYLYRDGANYKQYREVIFSNPNELSIKVIKTIIESKLIDSVWFIANEWGLEEQFFDDYAFNPTIDHLWHEFELVEETDLNATEGIIIDELLQKIKNGK